MGTPAYGQADATTSTRGFAIDRFEPSDRGSSWFVLESVDWSGRLRPAIGLVADFAHNPLVVYNEDGSQRTVVVENQLFTHVGATLAVVDRLRFGVNIPVALEQSGDQGVIGTMAFPPPESASFGDIRLSGDVRFFGGPGAAASLGAGVMVFVPTGDRDQYSGDGKVRIMPQLMFGGRSGAVEYALRAGFQYRGLEGNINGAALGSELNAAAAIGVRLADDKLLIGPELFGSTVVSSPEGATDTSFAKRTSPLEGLLGAHYALPGGWRLQGGVGLGLTRGLGSPKLRVVAGLEWMGSEAPPPPPDRDHDGILDSEDACPDVPGIRTSDPKTNGCPPPADRDGDGIVDPEDACPDVPGVKTEDPATNGCPPPPDRDGDTVIDQDDACPDVPGLVTNDPKTNGCPPARIEKQQIIITEQIKFKFNSSVILPESEPTLQAVREILASHPDITRLRIEGHTDDKGSAGYNKNLSRRRAQSVLKWLVKSGIERKRLYAVGFGEERPIDTNETDEGRQNNRRVEFHIDQPAQVNP